MSVKSEWVITWDDQMKPRLVELLDGESIRMEEIEQVFVVVRTNT